MFSLIQTSSFERQASPNTIERYASHGQYQSFLPLASASHPDLPFWTIRKLDPFSSLRMPTRMTSSEAFFGDMMRHPLLKTTDTVSIDLRPLSKHLRCLPILMVPEEPIEQNILKPARLTPVAGLIRDTKVRSVSYRCRSVCVAREKLYFTDFNHSQSERDGRRLTAR